MSFGGSATLNRLIGRRGCGATGLCRRRSGGRFGMPSRMGPRLNGRDGEAMEDQTNGDHRQQFNNRYAPTIDRVKCRRFRP